MKEEKEEPESSWLKHEQQVPEHSPTRQDQKDLQIRQEGEQLVQKQFIILMETSTLQEDDLSEEEPRTEQLSFPVSPVDKTKDQEGSSSTVSESRSPADTKKMSFRCDICGRSYKKNYTLKLHYRTHTGERPFTCEICGKCFCRRYELNVHQRTHTGERPFSCQTCNKSFSQISYLNVHKRIHTGERPFSCETCGTCFARRYHLNKHQGTHTG
ncbi:hypothetical protein ILYODFUR_036378 [Ilyodon furcidens]|uniref:C2H2-type domain-containing protein n=1 Tax=Ilyodon furcidens TaxID=33524 RepID=A0ABV0VLK2_9TELE